MTPGPRRFRRHGLVWLLGALLWPLAAQGCAPAALDVPAPTPQAAAALEAAVLEDSTNVDAVARLAFLRIATDSLESARTLLTATDALVPGDPAIPFLLAHTELELGFPVEAHARFADYVEDFGGPIAAHADLLREALEPLGVRARAARLLALEDSALSRVDDRYAVLPPIHAGADIEAAALAAAFSHLIAVDIEPSVGEVVDSRLVRGLLEQMGVDPLGFADLSLAQRLGRIVGASHVVQVDARPLTVDSLSLTVTVVSEGDDGETRVEPTTIVVLREQLPVAERTIARLFPDLRPELSDPNDVPHTTSRPALIAFGEALLAWDDGDLEAAAAAYTRAIEIDSGFTLARRERERLEAIGREAAWPVGLLLWEVVYVAELQRSVRALAAGSEAASVTALSRVGAHQRPVGVDLFGYDRIGGPTLVELVFTPPGVEP